MTKASDMTNNRVGNNLASSCALRRSQRFFMLEQKELTEYGGDRV